MKAFTLRGQEYRVAQKMLHVRRDGTTTEMVLLRSNCAECGGIFECRSLWPLINPYLNRRCPKCKSPGVRAQVRMSNAFD